VIEERSAVPASHQRAHTLDPARIIHAKTRAALKQKIAAAAPRRVEERKLTL
jgi:hypothetical protein